MARYDAAKDPLSKNPKPEYFKFPYWKTDFVYEDNPAGGEQIKIEKTTLDFKGRTGRYYTFLKEKFCATALTVLAEPEEAGVAEEVKEKDEDLPF